MAHVSAPGGRFEQAVNQGTDRMVPGPPVQRRIRPKRAGLEAEEEEEELAAEPLAERITAVAQRQAMPQKESLHDAFAAGRVPIRRPGEGGAEADTLGMPGRLKAGLERLSGFDLSGVRVFRNSLKPAAINALAYTQGREIHVAPGQEKHLPHEGWHAVQQMQGRVKPTVQAKGVSINDDASLEREADQMGARALRSMPLGQTSGNQLTTASLAAGPSNPNGARPTVQRRPKNKTTYVPYQVHVERPMTREEFRVAAMRQIFGGVLENLEWRNTRDSYVPENSPYTVYVDTQILKQQRGQASKERGISAGPDGVSGAEERAEAFHAGPESDEKSSLMAEIDRRYFEAIGDQTGTKIRPGEEGKSELWRMIRDEVLFQHEYIANLPPKVKELIRFSVQGRPLTPADYDKLFAIAKKIEKLPAGQVSDYASKVTATTTDLGAFEASLDKYIAEMAARALQNEERDKIQTKLIGLEGIYERYRLYKTLLSSGSGGGFAGRYPGGGGGGIVATHKALKMRQELETQLIAHGFAGVTDFEAFIDKFELAFEQEAANIAKDLLAQYAGKLYRESERYSDPLKVKALHQKLGGVRKSYEEFEAGAQVWNDYVEASEQARIPGQAHLRPETTLGEAEAARKKAEDAKATAESQVKGLAADHPIFEEESLPLDKRIDKVALAKASESQLGELLQGHIKNRMKHIDEARAEIEGKPELIYKMEKLMPHFYAQQGIQPGSIHDMIIQDKMREDAIRKLVAGIAFAIVAVALAVVTFGAATPAIVAAGAGIVGAGLGAYQAYESYQEYTQEKNLADVGFAKDPSVIWLIIAVAGAALDMAAAVKAVSALGKAAKALDAGGDLKTFTDIVRQLEKEKQITAEIARAAEKAGAARKGFAKASSELTGALAGKTYSFPGPLADPEVYEAVVKMAREAIKTAVYDAQKFIEELKLARVRAGLGDLTPEELAKAKQAWEEAKILEAAEKARYERLLQQVSDAAKLDDLIAKAGDAAKLERLLKVFPEAELETIFAKLNEPAQLVKILDHVGSKTGAGMIRRWMSGPPKGIAKMNQFLERLAAGGRELAETSAVGTRSLIIDSNTAIALMKDADPALRGTMNPGEIARVAEIKSLPAGTELRVGNVTVGEIQGGVLNVKGVPVEVARESAEYQRVLGVLETGLVGKPKGFADRGLIADALFAKTDPGVVPRFVTSDQNAVTRLARIAKIDVESIGGYPGLLARYGLAGKTSVGFNVTIEGRTLAVIPVP